MNHSVKVELAKLSSDIDHVNKVKLDNIQATLMEFQDWAEQKSREVKNMEAKQKSYLDLTKSTVRPGRPGRPGLARSKFTKRQTD